MKILRARLFEAERQRLAAQRRLVRNEQVCAQRRSIALLGFPILLTTFCGLGRLHRAARSAAASARKRFARTMCRRTA